MYSVEGIFYKYKLEFVLDNKVVVLLTNLIGLCPEKDFWKVFFNEIFSTGNLKEWERMTYFSHHLLLLYGTLIMIFNHKIY